MTREECEKALTGLLNAAIDIYRIYNPDGRYLAMCLCDGTVSINNRYWGKVDDDPPGEDYDRPINVSYEQPQEEDDEVQEVS